MVLHEVVEWDVPVNYKAIVGDNYMCFVPRADHLDDLATDPEYAAYHEQTMAYWMRLKRVVGEDIEIYDQLERTKRSSGYTRHILNERECKIAHYHQNMDRKIRSA
jgi:hypothetical protein